MYITMDLLILPYEINEVVFAGVKQADGQLIIYCGTRQSFWRSQSALIFHFFLKSLFESYSFLTSSIQLLLFYYHLVTLWFTSHQHLQLKDIGTVGDYKTYGQPWKQGQELKQSYISQVLHKPKQIWYLVVLGQIWPSVQYILRISKV